MRGWVRYEISRYGRRAPQLVRGTANPANEQPSGEPRRVTQGRVGFAKEPWGEANWTAKDIA